MAERKKEDAGTLGSLGVGETAVIKEVVQRCGMRRRLADLGFCRGERVVCVMESPLGDPRAYLVRGALIALRRSDAIAVLIEK